jgi:AI-2 transport protein TqsA
MNEPEETPSPPVPPTLRSRHPLGDLATLLTITLTVFLIALCWYLLKELVLLLRPLFLAGFLAYIIVPVQSQIRKHSQGVFARFALMIFVALVLFLVYLIIYRNLLELSNSLPDLSKRAQDLINRSRDLVKDHWPTLADAADQNASASEQSINNFKESAGSLVNYTTGLFIEAIEVCFYLIFIMLEAGRLPARIRQSFTNDRATKILKVIAGINKAMADFLLVKVRASLILALPICAVLWSMDIKFVSLWGLLFFFGNFIPYFGSFGAWVIVSVYCFLQLDFGWQPIALSATLLVLRTLSADLIEPRITGKAINVSPIVILLSLSFWSLCWGPVGMVLAVPLAVMLKIIMQNLPATQPFANLMAEE